MTTFHQLMLALFCLSPSWGDNPSWETKITHADEPGQPMTIEGVIYEQDGKTPIPGAKVYVYQTDHDGEYGPQGNSDPRIHGTMVTDSRGRFRFHSIRPGSYPSGRVPAHVHVHITAPGQEERISEFWFQDDPQISESRKQRAAEAGAFTRIIQLKRDASGRWQGQWNYKY